MAAFSGGQKRAELLRNPCILGDPQRQARGENQKWLPSRGPKRGRNCYVTPAFSAVPNAKRGEKIKIGCLSVVFSGAQKRVEVLRNPCILGGPQRQAQGENQKWLPHPCLLGGPKEGGIATQPLHSRGSPTPSAGRKSKVASVSGAQKRAEVLRNPCILGDPQRQARGENQKWLHSRGPKRGRNCYLTPTFSAVPNAKRGEKIKSGCLTLAFSGAQKRVEVLRNPCILGGPQRQARGENQKWLPHSCLLGGPKEGGSAT